MVRDGSRKVARQENSCTAFELIVQTELIHGCAISSNSKRKNSERRSSTALNRYRSCRPVGSAPTPTARPARKAAPELPCADGSGDERLVCMPSRQDTVSIADPVSALGWSTARTERRASPTEFISVSVPCTDRSAQSSDSRRKRDSGLVAAAAPACAPMNSSWSALNADAGFPFLRLELFRRS